MNNKSKSQHQREKLQGILLKRLPMENKQKNNNQKLKKKKRKKDNSKLQYRVFLSMPSMVTLEISSTHAAKS